MIGARFVMRMSEILTADATDLVSLRPAVCNRHAREQEVPKVDNMVANNPSGVRDDPSRPQSLAGKVVDCALPPTFHAEIRAGADQGYVHDPLIHDRVRKYRSTLEGVVAPPYNWQNENSLRHLVD